MAKAPAPTMAAEATAPPKVPSEVASAAPIGPAGPATAVSATRATTERMLLPTDPPRPPPSGRLELFPAVLRRDGGWGVDR
jgi:hypothetical protein